MVKFRLGEFIYSYFITGLTCYNILLYCVTIKKGYRYTCPLG